MSKYNLTNRVVAITGSTGGLGAAVVTALAERGVRLALFDLNATALEAQVERLGSHRARGWAVDVRSMDSISSAMAGAAKHFGQIDVVIANAGITYFEPLVSADPDRFDKVIDINLNGVWRTFRAAIPFVRESHGYMLAISSMAAFVHSPLQASYTASKAGVWAMCDSIRLELRHMKVGVGSVHPTFFHTPMMDQAFADPAGNKIWGGNKSGIWKMVSLDTVVSAVLKGIERREEFIVVPKQNGLVAKAPGFFRKFTEALGFSDHGIAETIRLAATDSKSQRATPTSVD